MFHINHAYGRVVTVPLTSSHLDPETKEPIAINPNEYDIAKDLSEARAVNVVVQIGGSSPRVVFVTDKGKTHFLCSVETDKFSSVLKEATDSGENLGELFFAYRLPRSDTNTPIKKEQNPNILIEELARSTAEILDGLGFDWSKLQSICFSAAGGLTRRGAINVPNQTFPLSTIHTQETFRSLLATYSGHGSVRKLPLPYLNDAEAGTVGEARHIGLKEGDIILNCQWGTGFGGGSKIMRGGTLHPLKGVEEFGYSCVFVDDTLEFIPIWTMQKHMGCVTSDNHVTKIPGDGTNLEFETAGYGLCRRICEWIHLADLGNEFANAMSHMIPGPSRIEPGELLDNIKKMSELKFVDPLKWKNEIHKDFMDLVNLTFFIVSKDREFPEGFSPSEELQKLSKELFDEISEDVASGLGAIVRFAMKEHDISRKRIKIVLGGPIANYFKVTEFKEAVKSHSGGVELLFSDLPSDAREALAFVPT